MHFRFSPSRKLAGIAVVAAVLALVAATFVFLGGRPGTIGASPRYPMADPAMAIAAGTDPVTFAVVGDSITANHAYPRQVAQRIVGQDSWVNFAQDSTTAFLGGWALGGATSGEMAAGLQPVSADVLVMIAGTNDIHASVGYATIGQNMLAIVGKSDVGRVLVSSVPPRNDFREPTARYNAWLHDFVLEQGWDWVDAARGLRAEQDPLSYGPGLSEDGVHPSNAGARLLGTAILAELVEQPTAVVAPATPSPAPVDDADTSEPPAGNLGLPANAES